MVERAPLLLELGTEELPAAGLRQLSIELSNQLVKALGTAGLAPGVARSFATPRRLAVIIDTIALVQPDRIEERQGPFLKAAFNDAGMATKAAEGFARACGVPVSDLHRADTQQGPRLVYRKPIPGRSAAEVLPRLIEQAVAELAVPRRMRWGDGTHAFSRPVHWIVLLLGETLVPASILGVDTGRHTFGHRFHHPAPLPLTSPAEFEPTLADTGHVLADFDTRRARIHALITAAARGLGGEARIAPDLLEEVTGLTEWPTAIAGRFDPRYLAVPHEALVTTMQENQRCFPVQHADGRLMPAFVAVANIESLDPDEVRRGNERVIRPRFADAEFFWNQDRRTSLADRLPLLAEVTFESSLGSLRDKADRLSVLAGHIAAATGANTLQAKRAAQLSKCDLVTQMVYEFPELQGTMGRYYALEDGESPEVAHAIEEQYLPRFAGDTLPSGPAGRALALADRLDTLVGIFSAGKRPSGTRDPFGLRRSALGVVRILLEQELDLDLVATLDWAAAGFPPELRAVEQIQPVFDFVIDRMRGLLSGAGVQADEFDAVLARRPTSVVDFHHRLEAVRLFRSRPEAASLAAANKRIRNILRRAEEHHLPRILTSALQEPSEQRLAREIDQLAEEVPPLVAAGDYRTALLRLASLKDPVDAFFDHVMVMVEDDQLRHNRLALLASLQSLFLAVADFSRLQD